MACIIGTSRGKCTWVFHVHNMFTQIYVCTNGSVLKLFFFFLPKLSVTGFLSSFTNYGWNYYAPFFFGFIEISSVPLSLLNAFNIRQDWVKEMPRLHLVTKILFAVTFIGARVFSWNANMHLFFRDTWRLVTASSSDINVSMTARVITFFAGDVPAVFLTVLQLFWASKIVEAVLLMISSGKTVKKQS
jgi:hypothetical protein